MAILKLKNDTTNDWEDIVTIKGDKGDKPIHEIDGTKIRFQNPDGTWGDWIELEVLTAEQVPTSDGSNVQLKIDNSFILGLDLEGNPYMQNDKGTVSVYAIDLNKLKITGKYYTNKCDNKPYVGSDGFLDVISINDNYVTQEYTPLTLNIKYKRSCIGGTWSDWQEIAGDTGWINAPDITNTSYRKKNGWAIINIQATLSASSGTWTKLFTLPVGIRPSKTIFGSIKANSSVISSINNNANILINTDGNVQYMNPNTSTAYIGSVIFPID